MSPTQQHSHQDSTYTVDKSLLNILGYMENLISVYQDERDALNLRDMKKFSDIQHKKTQLVHECEQGINSVITYEAALKLVSPALKERIFTTQNSLNTLALESQRICKIRAESTRRIQERLLDAARFLMSKNDKRYNKKGHTETPDRCRPASTSINEAI